MAALKNLREAGPSAALALVMLWWGLNLGYPMHLLQPIRWTLFGHTFPVYYLITAGLALGAGVCVLASKRGWTGWELLWCLLPLICLPGIWRSGDRIWAFRQWLSWLVRGPIPGGIIFLAACRRRPQPLLLWWVYPVILAAAFLGLGELAWEQNPLWDHPPFAVAEPAPSGNNFGAAVGRIDRAVIPQTIQTDNPFYRPHRSVFLSARPWGTQGNKVPYAATILAFFPLGLWLLKHRVGTYWVHVLGVAVLFSILILARARSGWVGLLAVLMAVPAFGLYREPRKVATLIGGLLLCLVLLMVWPKSQVMLCERMHSLRLTEQSIRERLAVLKTAKALEGRWLLGVGFGQFPTACLPYRDQALPWLGTPDNQYLRWTIENGILGLSFLAAFIIGLIRAGWHRLRLMADLRQADFYRAILLGWLGIAVTFLFFDGFYWGACNMTFWCLLGLFATSLTTPVDGASV